MDFQKSFTNTQLGILRVLWEEQRVTRRDLENLLDISRPTLDKAIKPLMAQDLIVADATTTSELRGRPASVFRLRDRAWLTIGMDFELPDVTIVLTDVHGAVVHETSFQVLEDLDEPSFVLRRVVEVIRLWLKGLGLSVADLGGMGIGLPGFFTQGGVSFVGRNLPAWKEVRVREYLEAQLSLPILMLHDVHCMAQAEVDHRSWTDRVVLFLSVRPGLKQDLRIGASLCIDGKAYLGGRGNGGALYRAVVEGDKLAGLSEQEAIEYIARRMASSLLHIIPLTDPEWVVIHAECLGDKESRLIESCQHELRQMFQGEYVGFSEIVSAASRERTGAQQAALAAIQSLLPPVAGSISPLSKGGADLGNTRYQNTGSTN
jgi:predicted transcriptional regulator